MSSLSIGDWREIIGDWEKIKGKWWWKINLLEYVFLTSIPYIEKKWKGKRGRSICWSCSKPLDNTARQVEGGMSLPLRSKRLCQPELGSGASLQAMGGPPHAEDGWDGNVVYAWQEKFEEDYQSRLQSKYFKAMKELFPDAVTPYRRKLLLLAWSPCNKAS